MRTPVVAVLVALAAAAAAFLLPTGFEEARALTAADLIGTWRLQLGGDGWQRADGGVDQGRVRGGGFLVVRADDEAPDAQRVVLEIVLDTEARTSMLGAAVPPAADAPAFRAGAGIVDNTVSAIYVGQPNYVNALNLRFDARSRKAVGTWFLAFPAAEGGTDADAFATGLVVSVKGKRVREPGTPKPARTAEPADSLSRSR